MKRYWLEIGFLLIAVLMIVFLLVSAVDASTIAKPDIIMTPSYTNYLEVYCTNGGSAAYFTTGESSGDLYCLPHRP